MTSNIIRCFAQITLLYISISITITAQHRSNQMPVHLILTAKLLPISSSEHIIDGKYNLSSASLGRLDRYNRCIDTALEYCKPHNISPIVVYADNYKRACDLFVSRGYKKYTTTWIKNKNQTFFLPDNAFSKYKYASELKSVQQVLSVTDIPDNDMVIKQIGRLCPCSDTFYQQVVNASKQDKEAVVYMYDKEKRRMDDSVCFPGIIAMRKKHWMEMRIPNETPVTSADHAKYIASYVRENIPSDRVELAQNVSLECSPSHNPDDLFYI